MDTGITEEDVSSLKFWITLFFIFFFIAIFGVFIVSSVLQVNTVTRFVCSQLALPTVNRVAEIIDGDAFEALSLSLDGEDPYYETVRSRMLEIKQQVNCLYLYTMAPVTDEMYRFIIDGSAPPDDEENFSPLGAEEDVSEYDRAFLTTMRTKTLQLGEIDQNETWGSLISVYAPILNSKGEAVGIIGCDLAADSIIEWIRTQVAGQIVVVLAVDLLGLFVYLLLQRKINRLLLKKMKTP
jgi:methyl-accepting chemotaxis protein